MANHIGGEVFCGDLRATDRGEQRGGGVGAGGEGEQGVVLFGRVERGIDAEDGGSVFGIVVRGERAERSCAHLRIVEEPAQDGSEFGIFEFDQHIESAATGLRVASGSSRAARADWRAVWLPKVSETFRASTRTFSFGLARSFFQRAPIFGRGDVALTGNGGAQAGEHREFFLRIVRIVQGFGNEGESFRGAE